MKATIKTSVFIWEFVTYIDRVWLKNHLVKIIQVIIPFKFLPFLLTSPTLTLVNLKLEQKFIVHLKINIPVEENKEKKHENDPMETTQEMLTPSGIPAQPH